MVILIRPTNFCTNLETLEDNKYMVHKEDEHSKAAEEEFDRLVHNLNSHQVTTLVFHQTHIQATDSVFPNNWFSTHNSEVVEGGLFILYPMKSKLRRLERNPLIIDLLKKRYKHFIDLTYLEEQGEYLESTGSLIFNYEEKTVYCSVSERASDKALDVFIEEFNAVLTEKFELIRFRSYDKENTLIYHTNCMMSVLDKYILLCKEIVCFCSSGSCNINNNSNSECRKNCEEKLNSILSKSKKEVVNLSYDELLGFSANCLNVRNSVNESKLIISKSGYLAMQKKNSEALAKIERDCDVIVTDLSNIEKIGGGSARCMVAEVF